MNRPSVPNSRESSRVSIKPRRISNTLSSEGMDKNDKETEKVPKKRIRVGKITRNPFFNFLREFRAQNNAMNVIVAAKAAGAVWRKMNRHQKEPYRKQAQTAPRSSRRTSEDY